MGRSAAGPFYVHAHDRHTPPELGTETTSRNPTSDAPKRHDARLLHDAARDPPRGPAQSRTPDHTWADGLRTFHGRPGCIAARHRFMATTPQGPGLQSFGKESPSGVQLNWPEALPRGPVKSDARMFKPVTLQAVAHQVAKTEHDQPGWCIFPDGAMDWTHDDRLGPPLQWAVLRLFHLTPHRLRGRQ